MEIWILFIPGSMSIRLNFLVAKHVVKLEVVCFVVVLFGGLSCGIAICFQYRE